MARTSVSLPFSGAALRATRERACWSQEDLANRTEAHGGRVGQDRISRYETGAAVPSVSTLGVLVKALGCSVDDLLHKAA